MDALAGRSLEELFVKRGVLGVEALREIMRGTLEGCGASVEVELSGREDRPAYARWSLLHAD